MTKKEIIKSLAKALNLTQVDSKKTLEAVLGLLEEALCKEEGVRLVGFGEFLVKKRASRVGRHPKTGEALIVPAHKAVTFSPGKTLMDRLNKGDTL